VFFDIEVGGTYVKKGKHIVRSRPNRSRPNLVLLYDLSTLGRVDWRSSCSRTKCQELSRTSGASTALLLPPHQAQRCLLCSECSCLCTGEKGKAKRNANNNLHFKDVRAFPDFWLACSSALGFFCASVRIATQGQERPMLSFAIMNDVCVHACLRVRACAYACAFVYACALVCMSVRACAQACMCVRLRA
jgi:hypothetical protein